MSKKRTSDESNDDQQAVFNNNQDNAKRANVDSNSDTTLQDLPMELLECIILQVVATEVMELRLIKSVWKEKVDPVIDRLRTVCSQWSHILSAISFRIKLNRILDVTAEKRILVEVLHESPPLLSAIQAVTTMNDEIFMLYKPYNQDSAIHVYDRDNMTVVKDIVPLPGKDPVCMAACNVSNCVYVGLRKKIANCLSILRISKDAEHQFSISPWMEDHRLCIHAMSVTANGSLIIISEKHQWEPHVLSIYDANGILQQETQMSQDIDASRYKDVIQRPNGNFILTYLGKQKCYVKLSEIDASGSIVHHYQSSHINEIFVCFADIYGRLLLAEPTQGNEVLDSEFNLLGTFDLLQDEYRGIGLYDLHYDRKRNEILRLHWDVNTDFNTLGIHRFREE